MKRRTAALLTTFASGVAVGWMTFPLWRQCACPPGNPLPERPAKSDGPSPEEEEREKRKEEETARKSAEEEEAFRQLQNYNADVAYGRTNLDGSKRDVSGA